MRVEKFKVFAKELGLEGDMDKLIYYYRNTQGDYSFTKKGGQAAREKYLPLYGEQLKKVGDRLEMVFPEWKGWEWSFGRTSSNECYIVIFNPEWK